MADPAPKQPSLEILITANPGRTHYWRDLWRFRELFLFLAWRDILVRYKQTSLGIAWALVRPLLTMLAFTLVFRFLAGMPDDGRPYPLVVLAGLLPWQFFASSINGTAYCILANTGMITKVYFPRAILPASTVVVNLVDLAVAAPLLLLLLLCYGLWPGREILALPFFLALLFCLAVGCGLWLAALIARFRDLIHVVPFLIQVGLYVSPVGFSSSAVPPNWLPVFTLNPLVAIIDGFRWCFLGIHAPSQEAIWVSGLTTLTLMISGWVYFRRTEQEFAETV